MKFKRKNLTSRAISVVLSASMLMCSGLATASSYITQGIMASAADVTIVESGSCGDDVNYTLDSQGVLTISGSGEMENYDDWNKKSPFYENSNIKKIIIEDGITKIGENAFSGCIGLISIEIPDGVTKIGDLAFYDCTSLTSITIPNSVISIGDSAFNGCKSLTSVEIGNGITSIGYKMFSECTCLESITIPENITSIGYSAFYGCSRLKKIKIPHSVKSVGQNAFGQCNALMEIEMSDDLTEIGGGAFNSTAWYKSQPDGVVYLGKLAYDYKGEMPENTHITIKEGTTKIASYLFSYCKNLTSVTIPNSVAEIGSSAFSNCTSLTSIEIPNSVTEIGSSAFSYCECLTSIIIPDSVTEIAYGVFSHCEGLTGVKIPNSVTEIGIYAFSDCKGLTSVEIPNSMVSIDGGAFYDCTNLADIYIPNSVISIGNHAFYNTAWYKNQSDGMVYAGRVAYKYKGEMSENTHIDIKDGTSGISDKAFYNCKYLMNITIPGSVTSIGSEAFYNTGLTGVTIPNSVMQIGEGAFNNCIDLVDIEIPDSIISIPYTFDSSRDVFGNTKWYENQPDGIIYVGKVLYKYKGTMPQNTHIDIKPGTTEIARGAFDDCEGLTEITIPKSVTSIVKGEKSWVFEDCPNLTIYGERGSYAENYADRYDIPFIIINTRAFGDTNGDGKVTIADSLMIARYEVKLRTLTDEQLAVSDVNYDGKVTIADALKIARYEVKLISSLER